MTLSTARARADRLLSRIRASILVAILAGLGRVGVNDRAMTLAGQAFTSILPFLILVTSLKLDGPVNRSLEQIGSQWLALGGGEPITTDATVASFGAAGAVMTLLGATSFSRALDRMYADIWENPRLGLAGWWRWPLVIATVVIGLTGEVFVVRGWFAAGPMLVELLLSIVLWAAIWAAIMRLLTAGRVGTVDVLATGVAVGVPLAAFFLATRLAFTPILAESEQRFGALGVVFFVLGWLFFYSWIVVAASVIVAVARTRNIPE